MNELEWRAAERKARSLVVVLAELKKAEKALDEAKSALSKAAAVYGSTVAEIVGES